MNFISHRLSFKSYYFDIVCFIYTCICMYHEFEINTFKPIEAGSALPHKRTKHIEFDYHFTSRTIC